MQADVATRQAFGRRVGKVSLPVRSKDTIDVSISE